ncbi:MAG: Fur family transcriptional regulator [Oscillospiraceae bacterium]|nr:Fur family transcriptional regulator [Oscillospiraceae bacterium]
MSLRSQMIVQDIVELFGKKNIRLTPQRIGVYRYLIENKNHPTVDTVYSFLKKENPSLSKTTIYNTVDTLEAAGLLRMVRASEGEVRLDAVMECHGHFVCEECGEIIDFSLDGCRLPDRLNQFQINNYEVRAFGVCPQCSAR